jgi:branched-chain amino acid transport system permease protein
MTLQKEKKTGTYLGLAFALLLLIVVVVLENTLSSTNILFTVLKKGAVYSLVAVSMNLLNGFTGLFSLGQAGFMLLGAYTYAILTVPMDSKDTVYYLYGGSAVKFSLPDAFGAIFGTSGVGGGVSLVLGVLVAILLAGLVASLFAYLIGLPVLRLKSDYLAIATLGFAEILRAIFQWQALGRVTNGANMLKNFPTFTSFNITDSSGQVILRLSTFVPFLIAIVCIIIIVMLINSSYGRAFKAIREDEIAAEAMGINLAKHKQLSFCISSFFAGIGGALFAMYASNAQAKVYTSTMTYEILLIVVIGGIGSISGSCLATFLYVACSEWWLRFLDSETVFASTTSSGRIAFILIFALVVIAGALLLVRRERKSTETRTWKTTVILLLAVVLLGWLAYFTVTGQTKLPLLRNGFRMVVFSIVIMIVVLFFRKGIMGDKEFTDVLKNLRKSKKKEAAK